MAFVYCTVGTGEESDKMYLWNGFSGEFELLDEKAPAGNSSLGTYGYISLSKIIEKCSG